MLIWFSKATLCDGLSEEEIASFYSNFVVRGFAPGAPLYREGDPADAIYVLLEGRVEVSRGGALLGEVGPGATVGEMSLFRGSATRSATITPASQVTTVMLLRQRFLELLRTRDVPTLVVVNNLAHELAERLMVMNARLAKPG